MSKMIVRLDSNDRLVVPKSKRDLDALEDGDVFIYDPSSESGTITFVKVDSPLLKQLAESEVDHATGRFQTIEEVAAELGINLECDLPSHL